MDTYILPRNTDPSDGLRIYIDTPMAVYADVAYVDTTKQVFWFDGVEGDEGE